MMTAAGPGPQRPIQITRAGSPAANAAAARTEFGYARTECACERCALNCHFMPGYLVPADLHRVARLLGFGNVFEFAARHLVASPGALVMSAGRRFRIKTLVPARRPDGACVFLDEGDRCRIHEWSPYGCSFFDDHQTREEADIRSAEGLRAVHRAWLAGGVYSFVWRALCVLGRTSPPAEELRAKMKRACDEQTRGDTR
jgi:Fe-S-cluster containining protein